VVILENLESFMFAGQVFPAQFQVSQVATPLGLLAPKKTKGSVVTKINLLYS